MSYETKTLTATAQNPLTGETSAVSIVVPAELPSEAECDRLVALWTAKVEKLDGHWKGQVRAFAATLEEAQDIAKAFEFMGALPDFVGKAAGSRGFTVYSRGYWAHGF